MATLLPVVSPTYSGLGGRGTTTSPGPAMVRMDRKDLNSDKTKKRNEENFGRKRFGAPKSIIIQSKLRGDAPSVKKLPGQGYGYSN